MDVYSSKNVEAFAINVIGNSFDQSYLNFVWNDKKDDFDFVSSDRKNVLEVTLILTSNEREAVKYIDALSKGKSPDPSKVIDSYVDDEGNLIHYYGGSMEGIRSLILKAISKKNDKALRRRNPDIVSYELCIAINDGGLFHKPADFFFILEANDYKNSIFDRVFIITSTNFFVLSEDGIIERERTYLPKEP